MSDDLYKTIEGESIGAYSDKGSKFLAFAKFVETEEDVKEYLNLLKKKYHDARHHVYAFVIGQNYSVYRASDDGEPANSSGMPVLGQIRSFGLTNTAIVVVRYFGGTKLGVPGLINAYKTAAFDALSNAMIVTKTINAQYVAEFSYEEVNFVMKYIKDYNAEIVKQNFTESCELVFNIRLSLEEKIINSLNQNHKIKLIKIHV